MTIKSEITDAHGAHMEDRKEKGRETRFCRSRLDRSTIAGSPLYPQNNLPPLVGFEYGMLDVLRYSFTLHILQMSSTFGAVHRQQEFLHSHDVIM